MQTEEEIITSMISSIKEIKEIIKSEIIEIDHKGNSKKQIEKDPIDEIMRTTPLQTSRSYLDFYRKILDFLHRKLESGTSDEEFFFYMPLLRTLIEIYAYLLYFCFQDKEKQTTLAVVNTLNTVAKLDTDNISPEIKTEYDKTYSGFKKFFETKNLNIPTDPAHATKAWLKTSGYGYPSVEQMLKKEWIKSSSPQTNAANKNASENSYKIYRYLSNYVHGNILSKEHHGNEKMWVISETILLSMIIAELVSVKILNNSKRKEIGICLKKVSKNSKVFRYMWANRDSK